MKTPFLPLVIIPLLFTTPCLGDDGEEDRFAAFRIVRAVPGEPGKPEITLPDGYEFVEGDRYHVASRAEYYTFVRGPENREGVPVQVSWPGESIKAVIGSNRRLELSGENSETVSFHLPVVARSPNADQSTIQVWSHLESAPGIRWRIEHNDPDRAAGPWTGVPWPANQARAVIHFKVASEAILIDSGIAETAHSKGHFLALMGFETNNTLHPDNPPHWHLVYFAGNTFTSPAYLPHYWVNDEGRNFYNGMDVTGKGRSRLHAGDPGPMYDFDGNLALTTTIREDGGLDIEGPEGPVYAIVPGSSGNFVDGLAVTRDGERWIRVTSSDDFRTGVMVLQVMGEKDISLNRTIIHTYDRLTGRILGTTHHPLSGLGGN